MENSVTSGLTSTTAAPAPSAAYGREAAGCTVAEVPTTTAKSHSSRAESVRSRASAGSISPNQTTPGRSIPAPQAAQRGGAGLGMTVPGSCTAGSPQSAQR